MEEAADGQLRLDPHRRRRCARRPVDLDPSPISRALNATLPRDHLEIGRVAQPDYVGAWLGGLKLELVGTHSRERGASLRVDLGLE